MSEKLFLSWGKNAVRPNKADDYLPFTFPIDQQAENEQDNVVKYIDEVGKKAVKPFDKIPQK